MSNFTTEEKVSLLFKKSVGKPSTDPSIQFFSEPPIDARPKVFTTQIFSQAIPVPRPSDGWDSSVSSPGDTAEHSSGILKHYFKWPLEKVTNGNDMSFKAIDDNGENPLQGSVPFNLDPAGGYGLELFRQTAGTVGAQIYDGTGDWVVDPDAGVLTFYQHEAVSAYVSEDNPPYLSFFRYIGSTGLTAASQWTTVDHGIKFNEANKTVLVGRDSSEASGTYDLEVNGDVKIHGQVVAEELTCMSDRRLKRCVRVISQPLRKLQAIRGVRFRWRASGKVSYGVIADEVEKVMPDSTNEGPSGHKNVNYNAVIALLVETVKRQAKTIQAIETQIKQLR